jgi:hypothetical protein
VNVLANAFSFGHGGDHRWREIIRVRAGKPQAPDSGKISNRAEEACEIILPVEVGVHGLAEQNDLGNARCNDSLALTNYFRETPASLGTTRRGHNAVGAFVIAAPLHGNPRLDSLEAARSEVLVVLLEIEFSRRRPNAMAGALQQGREIPITIWPDHEAHVTCAVQQLLTETLRHASRDTEYGIALHPALHFSKPPNDPLLSVLADRAGIDQDDVGRVRLIYGIISGLDELPEHQLGVAHVHLTPVGLDVNGTSWRLDHHGILGYGPLGIGNWPEVVMTSLCVGSVGSSM